MIRRLFLDHPASVGESYTAHFRVAGGFGLAMLTAAGACFLHALVPAPKLGANSVTEKTRSNVRATAAGNGHVATATTKSGKTIHYDCSKAGNKNKAACKA